MICLHDFVVGQQVFITDDIIDLISFPSHVSIRKVEHIGRKYITLEGNWHEKFYIGYGKTYLIEKTEYGSPRRLYTSLQAIKDDKERIRLWTDAKRMICTADMETIDLEKYRKIVEILEEAEKEKNAEAQD